MGSIPDPASVTSGPLTQKIISTVKTKENCIYSNALTVESMGFDISPGYTFKHTLLLQQKHNNYTLTCYQHFK